MTESIISKIIHGMRSNYFSAITAQIFVVFINLATSIITARSLSPDDRGHLGLMLLIPTVGGALLHFGMPQAIPILILRGMRRDILIATGLVLALAISLGGSIITLLSSLIVAHFYDPARSTDYAIIGACAGGMIFLPFAMAILAADRKFFFINAQRISSAVLQLSGIFLIIIMGSANAFILALLGTIVPIFLSFLIFLYYKFELEHWKISRPYAHDISLCGLGVFRSYIGIFFISMLDRILAPTIMTPSELGYYFICTGCVAPLIAISESARNILLMSYSHQSTRSSKRTSHIGAIFWAIGLYIIISTFVALFGGDIITLLFGKNYEPAGKFITYAGISVAAQALSRYSSVILEAENKAMLSATANFVGVILIAASAAGAMWTGNVLVFLTGLAMTHTAVALVISTLAIAANPTSPLPAK